jgi:D-sedoheptulose 7-phosphate isomerase
MFTPETITSRIARNIEVCRCLLTDSDFHERLIRVANEIASSIGSGGKIFFFGNGGSAADAQHLAAEFTGRYLVERRALPAIALTVNASSLTAIGNDYSFESIFARQIEALGTRGDVAVGISTSGSSKNVIRALDTAKSKSILTVALTGATGGLLKDVAHYTLRIPSQETPRIQEAHILVGHIICEMVESSLVSNESHASDDPGCVLTARAAG